MCLSRASKWRALLLAVVIICVMLLSCAEPTSTPTQAAQQDDLTAPMPQLNKCGDGEGTSFTLAAVGDLLLHSYIQDIAEQRGYGYLFERVRPFLENTDLAYANFEGTANPGRPRSEYPLFNYNPALATAVKNTGVDVVSTANNHALDTGSAGVDATIDSLNAAGVLHHGTTKRGTTKQPYLPLTITAKNGETVKAAFLSFTFSTNGVPDPFGQVNMLWDSRGNLAQPVRDAVYKARQETDLVIVAVHWGNEYQFYPTQQQRQGAEDLAAAGADVILGDHPHTLQPADWLEMNGRRIMVIYSLGNFIASQNKFQAESYTQTSLIFYVGFTRTKSGRVEVNGYRYLPVFIEYDLRPVPITPGNYANAYRHVLTEMRDPAGAHLVSPFTSEIGPAGIQVCRTETFKETGQKLSGDFYDYYHTLGSGQERVPTQESLAIVGFPTGPVKLEASGDCQRVVPVLYTERQRLELQLTAEWPYRVVGTQLGTEVYKTKYKVSTVERRLDLDGDAIVSQRFRSFFERYGGLTVFGYPISGELTEKEASTGQSKSVQYFERARFEYTPGTNLNPNPLYQVQLGLLGREYAGIAAQCK